MEVAGHPRHIKKREFIVMTIAALRAFGAITMLCSFAFTAAAQTAVSPAEARAIAKEAYIYGYPLVDSYRVEYAYSVDRKDPEFKARWNEITNIPRALDC